MIINPFVNFCLSERHGVWCAGKGEPLCGHNPRGLQLNKSEIGKFSEIEELACIKPLFHKVKVLGDNIRPYQSHY